MVPEQRHLGQRAARARSTRWGWRRSRPRRPGTPPRRRQPLGSAASTSVSASRLAWTSLRMAMRMRQAPRPAAQPSPGRRGRPRGRRSGPAPELGVAGRISAAVRSRRRSRRELLHREAGQHAPDHDGPAHGRAVRAARRPRQVAHEAAGEAVAGAGRIEERRPADRPRPRRPRSPGEEERAVLAPLHHHRARAEAEDAPGRLDDVVLAGQLRAPRRRSRRAGRPGAASRSRLSRLEAIQKFMVSQATKRGARTWSSTVALQVRVDVAEEDVARSRGRPRAARAGSRRRR